MTMPRISLPFEKLYSIRVPFQTMLNVGIWGGLGVMGMSGMGDPLSRRASSSYSCSSSMSDLPTLKGMEFSSDP